MKKIITIALFVGLTATNLFAADDGWLNGARVTEVATFGGTTRVIAVRDSNDERIGLPIHPAIVADPDALKSMYATALTAQASHAKVNVKILSDQIVGLLIDTTN